MKAKKLSKEKNSNNFSRKRFIEVSALGVGSLFLGKCESDDNIPPVPPKPIPKPTTTSKVEIPIPSSASYRFGIMGDTQWVNWLREKVQKDDGTYVYQYYYEDDGKKTVWAVINYNGRFAIRTV